MNKMIMKMLEMIVITPPENVRVKKSSFTCKSGKKQRPTDRPTEGEQIKPS